MNINNYISEEKLEEQQMFENVLLEICRAVAERKDEKTCNIEIEIEFGFEDPFGNFSDYRDLRITALSSLTEQGIIENYKIERVSKVDVAKCKVSPQKVIDYAVGVFKYKKTYCEELADNYVKLIDLVETYLKEPVIDTKLNKYYIALSDKIENLLQENVVPSLNYNKWKPFENLFTATNSGNLQKTTGLMRTFLGEIYKFIDLFEVEPKDKEKLFKSLEEYWAKMKSPEEQNARPQNTLKSIYLVSKSIAGNDTIFLVLDEQWEMPIRFSVLHNGIETAIKKLHNIAYPTPNAPNKKVEYNKNLADNINNGLFKNKKIRDYMKTNKLKKPTIVKKTKDNCLVLSGEISVKEIPFEQIPPQHRSIYIDKTR